MKKLNRQTVMGLAGVAVLAASSLATYAQTNVFRTLAYGVGIYQSENAASKPVYSYEGFAGHDIVAAALGEPLATVLTNQVLALKWNCSSNTASLVVFDKPSSNVVATIATSTSIDIVQQQDHDYTAYPNRERFVAQFTITPTNHLVSGFLTIAGRLQLDPTNGCPWSIRVKFDHDDHLFADADSRSPDDKKDNDVMRSGVGHAVGTLDLVFDNGTTNKVLLPYVALSMRRELQ